MKSVKIALGLLALVPALSFAQDAPDRPPRGEFFDTVLESVDEATAAELQASRDELSALHDEIRSLREADEVDEEALDAAIASLRSEREGFREEIRSVVDENEDLQAALEEARANADFPGHNGAGGHRGQRPNRGDVQ